MSTADYSWMSVTLQKGEVEEEEGEPESLVSAEFSQSRPQHPRVVLLLASFPLMYSKVIWLFCGKHTRPKKPGPWKCFLFKQPQIGRIKTCSLTFTDITLSSIPG